MGSLLGKFLLEFVAGMRFGVGQIALNGSHTGFQIRAWIESALFYIERSDRMYVCGVEVGTVRLPGKKPLRPHAMPIQPQIEW